MQFVKAGIRITFLKRISLWFCIPERKLYRRRNTSFESQLLCDIENKNSEYDDIDDDTNLNTFFDYFNDPSKITYDNCKIYSSIVGVHFVYFNRTKNEGPRDYLAPTSFYEILNGKIGSEKDKKIIDDFENSLFIKYENPPKTKIRFGEIGQCDSPVIPCILSSLLWIGVFFPTFNWLISFAAFFCSLPIFAIIYGLIEKFYVVPSGIYSVDDIIRTEIREVGDLEFVRR